MKRNLFAILLALTLVVALAFVVAPTAKAANVITVEQLPEVIETNDLILDLKGQEVEVNVAEGYTLSVINTAIREKDGVISNAGKLTNIGSGSIATVAQDPTSKVRFLAVGADKVYTVYPFSLMLSQQGINTLAKNPDEGKESEIEPAACIRVSFMAFSPLFDKIEEYGFIVDDKEYPAEEKFNKNVTDLYADLLGSLRGAMDEDNAKIDTAKPVQGYIKIAGQRVTTALLNFTPRDILKGINKDATINHTPAQEERIVALFDDSNYGRVKNILTRFRTEKKDAELSFSTTDNRLSQDNSKQVWSQNGIVFTNNKASSTTNVANYSNPVRLYKSSEIVVEASGMTKIVFNCASNYVLSLPESANYEATTTDTTVTVEFSEAVDSFTATMAAQTRFNSIVVTALLPGECDHHGGTATCTEPAVCIDCDQYHGELVEHDYNEETHLCTSCGTKDPDHAFEMSISEALDAANGQSLIVSGTVSGFYETWSSYGNCSPYISDGNGNTILVFRTTEQVGIGDKVTVTGKITVYNSINQIAQGSTLVIDEKHVCSDYTEATCTKLAACVVCGATKGELAEHNIVDGACTNDGCSYTEGNEGGDTAEPTTVTVTMSALGWTNESKYTSLAMDDNISVNLTGGTNTGKFYTSGNNWRLYQTESAKLTISAANGKTITSVKITFTVSNSGQLKQGSTVITSGSVVNVNADTIEFNVGGTASKQNGQVRITAIEVIYQ